MAATDDVTEAKAAHSSRLPSRLHHMAYVTHDLEATRRFYEELIGLPLVATWCEVDERFGARRVYCHIFFGIADGGALAFFKFADPCDQELFGPKMPATPFHHIALKVDEGTQRQIEQRLIAAGYERPQVYVLEHGYCRSLYVTDPNGLTLELTLDDPEVIKLAPQLRAKAHAELKRWIAGDHTSNNSYR